MTSDLPIPRLTDIIARALDIRDSAVRLRDAATVRQLDRLIGKLPTARLCWKLGMLHIGSPSGGRYQVTRAGCSCLNAQRCGKRACWHVALFELLLDLFDTHCETLDMQCDPPGDNPLGDDEGDTLPSARVFGQRLSAARAVVWGMR